MYFNILKEDLKRKKTMNVILLLFIIIASTFVSSSVNNLLSISSAMDDYIAKADSPNYFIFANMPQEKDVDNFIEKSTLVDKFNKNKLLYLDKANVKLNDSKISAQSTIAVGSIKTTGYKVFDSENNAVSSVPEGEIFLTSQMAAQLNAKIGDKITIESDSHTLGLTFTKTTKDLVFSSPMAGITRYLVSEKDYQKLISDPKMSYFVFYGIKTGDVQQFENSFNKSGISTFMVADISLIKMMYIMDMVIAGVMLLVSVCLIIISIIILRFTIVFTLNEEFREIGVMKAIGIGSRKIRGLYIVKYFAVSALGSFIGFFAGIPFGSMLIRQVSENIIISASHSIFINIICCIAVVLVVTGFSYLSTGMVKKFSPIEAIRNGSNGERYKSKGVISLNRSRLGVIPFMALNDIFSGLKKFMVLILTFTIGFILIIIPINSINTLSGEHLVKWFSMAESDLYIPEEAVFTPESSRADVQNGIDEVKKKLAGNNIPASVFKETIFKFSISKGDKSSSSIVFQGTGVGTDQYTYTYGTPPENADEIADKLGADIGDTIKINMGDKESEFIVTAIYQSMNNSGQGIRLSEKADLNYAYAMGQFATQIKYTDNPSPDEEQRRMELIKKLYPDKEVMLGGEYVNEMLGDIAESLSGVKNLIIIVVLCINALVVILMVKTLMTREKGEIGMLKAIGFRNGAIIMWQCMRIGIILLISIIIGALLSGPVSQISSGAVFRMMGASSVEFEIRPIEVYIIYPLIIFTVTMLASFLTAQQSRRISASETRNIE
jgi:putative ABC transport system permease protein